MSPDITISLNYLTTTTFKALKSAETHNPDIIAMMSLPKINVELEQITAVDCLEGLIKTSIKQGEHHDIVLATLFNLITSLQKAIYLKYNTGLHNNKLTRECTQLLRLYCETRSECDSALVKLTL